MGPRSSQVAAFSLVARSGQTARILEPVYQIPPDDTLLDLRGSLFTSIRDQGDELDLSPDGLGWFCSTSFFQS